jgi:DnaJ-domain-containing protein 1
VDPELREALDQLGTNLRGEVRSVDAGLREALNQVVVDLRGEIRESESRMRLHFDVVGESLRSDIRAVAEGMVASREQTDRRIDEQAGRTDGLEGRVVRLEVRVTDLKNGRKPRRPRRRR